MILYEELNSLSIYCKQSFSIDNVPPLLKLIDEITITFFIIDSLFYNQIHYSYLTNKPSQIIYV